MDLSTRAYELDRLRLRKAAETRARRDDQKSSMATVVSKTDAYSWTQGNQSDLNHEALIASGGFSEVHKVHPFPHDGTLKRIDEKLENWKGTLYPRPC
jgi:hypothetical protein